MITIKSHFSFSGINIPSTVTCSITSYFKGDTFIQDIDFPTTLITEPLGQNYINNNKKQSRDSRKLPNPVKTIS